MSPFLISALGQWGDTAISIPFCFCPKRAPVLFGVAACLMANTDPAVPSQLDGGPVSQSWPGGVDSSVRGGPCSPIGEGWLLLPSSCLEGGRAAWGRSSPLASRT